MTTKFLPPFARARSLKYNPHQAMVVKAPVSTPAPVPEPEKIAPVVSVTEIFSPVAVPAPVPETPQVEETVVVVQEAPKPVPAPVEENLADYLTELEIEPAPPVVEDPVVVSEPCAYDDPDGLIGPEDLDETFKPDPEPEITPEPKPEPEITPEPKPEPEFTEKEKKGLATLKDLRQTMIKKVWSKTKILQTIEAAGLSRFFPESMTKNEIISVIEKA